MLNNIQVDELIWDIWNISHISRHNINPDEVGEVCLGKPVIVESYSKRLIVIGGTHTGKIITVVLAKKREGNYYPVTAYSASRKQRRFYEQQKTKKSHT